jgi:hypothetical protein
MQEPLISGGLAFQEMGCVCVPWMVGKILLLTGRCQIFSGEPAFAEGAG